MKFTKGFWWLRDGVVANHPAEVYEVETTADELRVFAPVQPIEHRGSTLNCPMITAVMSSPIEGVIKVQLSHFAGAVDHGPEFELHSSNPSVDISKGEDLATLTTGNLRAEVDLSKGNWGIRFMQGGRELTNSGFRNVGYMEDQKEGCFYMKEELALGVGESIYGMGERFTPFIKNGQVIDMWNDDGGTASEISYKNIPFYLSSKGYGVYVNHPEKISFEVGSEKVERVGFSVPGEKLEYYVIAGADPSQILDRYTSLTGRPGLPPQWSFGLWLTTSFTTDYDEETVTGFVKGMEERDLPLHVFHFDCFWMKGFHWIDLEWDPEVFPDPKGMLERLKARGLKICVWINPYIAQRSSMFNEALEKGYLLMKNDGSVYQRDMWQAGMGLIDFTNPEATAWYKERLGALVDMGVDSFKTDFGEQIPTDVVYHDGSDPIKMHNYYTYLYNESVFEILEEKLGFGEAVLFARSATVGGQKFPVHWGGDCTATYESMAESLRGGLSLCLSGYGFWSHDMGGFESTASPDVYKRWVAFGCLSSHSRLHGSGSYRVPWLYDEESVDVLRTFTKLKCQLMPYLYQKAAEAHLKGSPVMRALCYEFPNDPGAALIDRQYMLGEALMVCPIFDPNGDVEYFLPEGNWTDFLTGEKKTGGKWIRENYDYFGLPLLARENSVIPLGTNDSVPDYVLSEDVVFHIFDLEDGKSVTTTVPDERGQPATVISFQRCGDSLTLTPHETSGKWTAVLRGIESVSQVQNGEEQTQDLGVQITPNDPNTPVVITVS